jgi:hypothetical protein
MQNMPCGHKTFQFQKNPIRQDPTLCHDYQTHTPNTSNNKKKHQIFRYEFQAHTPKESNWDILNILV